MSRHSILLLASAFFAILAWSVQEPDPDRLLGKEAERLQHALDDQSLKLKRSAESHARQLNELGPEQWMQQLAKELEAERVASGAVYLGFEEDSLVCWSGKLSEVGVLRALAENSAQYTYAGSVHQHAFSSAGGFQMHAFGPVWEAPPIENRYLQKGFHHTLHAPNKLALLPAESTGPVLLDANGLPFFRIGWLDGSVDVGSWILWKLILALLAGTTFVAFLWSAASERVQHGNPVIGTLAFISILLAARWGVLTFLPAAPFDRLSLFDPAIYAASAFFPSLADLCINAILLAVAFLFLRRAARSFGTFQQGFWSLTVSWTIVLAFAAWVTNTLIGLVNDSSVDLDLFHVQQLDLASGVALFSIAVMFASWMMLASTSIALLGDLTKPVPLVLSGMLVLTLSIVLHHTQGIRDTLLYLWPPPLLILLYHAHQKGLRFIHVVIGLAALAMITSHVLMKYTQTREQRERLVLAERLSVREDPVVELLFREVAPLLRTDPQVYALIASPIPCSSGELDRVVRQVYFGGYWERYDVRVFAFDSEGHARCSSDGSAPRSTSEEESKFLDHTAVVDMPDLFFHQGGTDGPYYHATVAIMPQETAAPALLIIELHPRSAAQSLGFPELLLSGDDPLLRRAERYTVARYEQGRLVDQSGNSGVPLFWQDEVNAEGVLWYEEDGIEYLARGAENGTLLTLGLPLPGWMDRATTFSYLFALFSLLLALIMLVRMLIRSKGIPDLGIAGKVRLALLLFAVVGLIFFGYGTQQLLTRQYLSRSEANSLEKARSAHIELQQKLDGQPKLDKDLSRYLEHLLAQLSNVLFTDIAVYDLQGRVLASSRPQVFSSGLLGSRMDAVAYAELVVGQASAFVHQERIGTANYLSAYLPLRDRRGDVLGYIALPSFADQAQQEQERAGVLVAVVNLFVLFFALSVLVALFISNWTTRPLDLLKRSLAMVALGATNKPIIYRGNDEVGQLVEVYNQKVEELRESAERLAQSERESAWREMAQQVAHEIKNPLTPMKLSIQHFQRTWTPGATDAAAKLERFSSGLVQQIDALSGIASAFGDFARMPQAHPELLDLGKLAALAIEVFGSKGKALQLQRGTDATLMVHADREQLLRVINNLLKNAFQSIPDDREAEVIVRVGTQGAEVVLEIQDNGVGIAAADKERIFQPNFTTKSSGMGLGLAMVKRIVENAAGTVRFTTEVDKGTSFFVSLPLRS